MPRYSNTSTALGQENIRPTSGTKTVRIASPPTTSHTHRDILVEDRHDPSSRLRHEPKQSLSVQTSSSSTSAFDQAESVNPFEAELQEEDDEDSEDQEMRDNTRQNSAILVSSHHTGPGPGVEFSQKSPVQGEEPSKRGSAGADRRTVRPTVISRAGSGQVRASLDVDAFTRLIMTGEKDTKSSGTPPTPPAPNLTPQSILGDSSSNTDTSSISRQSLFESMTETVTDTPRTSHEISVSDDEWQQLVGASSVSVRNTDTQPSSVRYGLSVPSNMPRTVSFDGSSPPSTTLQTPPYPIDGQASTTPSQPPVSTDLNKPLPPRPSHKQPEPSTTAQHGYSRPDEFSNSFRSTSPLSISYKKRPPTPPLARRHSQLRSPNLLLARSNSARLPSSSAHGLWSSSQLAHVKTPPPPPTRRTLPSQLQPSVETSTAAETVLSGSPPPVTGSIRPENQHTSKPPLPPMRTHSISSIKRPYRPPPAASAVPRIRPAPPPRSRGSSQSSLVGTRVDMRPKPSAAESSSTVRRGSKVSEREDSTGPLDESSQMPDPVSGPNANDILADLSALQREVDELRGMYEIRRASE